MEPVLALAFDDLAKIVIFAIIAIGALIQKILKERAKHGPAPPHAPPHAPAPEDAYEEYEQDEEHEEVLHGPRHEAPGRHPAPARHRPFPPPAPPRPRAPVGAAAAGTSRAPGSLGGLSAAGGEGRPLTDFESTRLHLGDKGAARSAPATVTGPARERTGVALLLGKDLTRHDRVRSGVLWREVLGPPLSLREPE